MIRYDIFRVDSARVEITDRCGLLGVFAPGPPETRGKRSPRECPAPCSRRDSFTPLYQDDLKLSFQGKPMERNDTIGTLPTLPRPVSAVAPSCPGDLRSYIPSLLWQTVSGWRTEMRSM